jgi:hypothetical protein
MFNKKWKAALAGAVVCGLVGPGTALLLLEAQLLRPSSFREVVAVVAVAVKGWIFAFGFVGPAAVVLGCVCGVMIQSLARKYRPIKVAIVPAATVGLVLGSVVPAVTILVAAFWVRQDSRHSATREILHCLPVSAFTGVICASLLLWLFRAAPGSDKIRS